MSDSAKPLLTIRLFGPFEALLDGAPLPGLRRRKAQWLLSLLALRAGRAVERAWLAGLLWPETAETTALKNLRSSLADLRHALGPAATCLRSPTAQTLCLDLTSVDADVVAFDAAIAAGDEASLGRAAALYRGPLLEGSAQEWAFQERQLRELAYLAALETLAARALTRGEVRTAERHLRRAVSADPLLESAQRALMRTLVDDGNYAAAVVTYRELRLRLHREINTEPDAATTALFQQLRAEARAKSEDREQPPAASHPSPVGSKVNSGAAHPPVTLPELATGDLRLTSGTVTFLFTDIEGSTRLWEQHPEAMQAAVARHDALLREAIEPRGGHVFKTVGDQFCVAFVAAPEALAAALAAQQALQTEPWPQTGPLRVRVALHTGTVQERDGDYFGPPLNRVARLLEAGHGGQVLLSLGTQDLVRDALPEGVELRDLGKCRLRDLARPEHIFQLAHPGLPSGFPPLNSLDIHPHNLIVQRGALLGRETEGAALGNLLRQREAGLVTLTGPGGIGKTRLALQVAADLLDDFPQGVFFVNLAAVTDPEFVASAIAHALEVQETRGRPLLESLKQYLRQKALLLVLDNFEQVLEAAPVVAELLAAAPDLKILVTSRSVLHLRDEKEFPVPPLALPDRERPPAPEQLSQYAAVMLFIQRALDARPDFAITNENAPAVAEICRHLDGLPLAIELAAARTKLFSPQALLSRLDRRLKLLTGGARDLPVRHQTLWGAITWSYDLLPEKEKRLFRRLSVFVGGCTIDAAEAVGNGAGDLGIDVLDRLTSLIDKSLLQQEESADHEPRLVMLETIREYGLECLEASGEAAAVRQPHAAFFLALAEQAEPELWGPAQEEWLDRLEAEHENLRAVLAWSRTPEGNLETGLLLAGTLDWFWHFRGYQLEGFAWLEAMLAQTTGSVPARARAKALLAAGALARIVATEDQAQTYLTASLNLGRELGDQPIVVWSLTHLGHLAVRRCDHGTARQLFEESHCVRLEMGDRWGKHFLLNELGSIAEVEGDYQTARRLYEESLARNQEVGVMLGVAAALVSLGRIAAAQHDYEAACRFHEEGLAIRRRLGHRSGMSESLGHLAGAAATLQDWERALCCAEEALLIHRNLSPQIDIAWALQRVGWYSLVLQDPEAARSVLEESLAIGRELGDDAVMAHTLHKLGECTRLREEFPAARAFLKESRALCRKLQPRQGVCGVLLSQIRLDLDMGEYGPAVDHGRELLALCRELGGSEETAQALEAMACIHLGQGRPEQAAHLFGAADALGLPAGPSRVPHVQRAHEEAVAAARTALGEAAFAAAWAEGRTMSLEQSLAYALEATGAA